MSKKLDKKIAVITGGADGIGKAAVEKFLNEGAIVWIWDFNQEKGEELAARLGENCFFARVDTRDEEQLKEAVAKIIERHGAIDILVNNAGITRDATMKKMTPEQWQDVIDVNLTGVFNCARLIAPHMIEKGFGRIINTSSVVALYGNFGQSNYVATKAGLIGLTRVWAREFGPKGITVNAVAPGFILTDMVKKMPEKVLDMMKEKVPLGRLGDPSDIASAYAFLASDEASYINGTTLSVDGGMTI